MAEIKPNLDGEKKGKLDNDSGRNKKNNPFFKCKNQNYNRKPIKRRTIVKSSGTKRTKCATIIQCIFKYYMGYRNCNQ